MNTFWTRISYRKMSAFTLDCLTTLTFSDVTGLQVSVIATWMEVSSCLVSDTRAHSFYFPAGLYSYLASESYFIQFLNPQDQDRFTAYIQKGNKLIFMVTLSDNILILECMNNARFHSKVGQRRLKAANMRHKRLIEFEINFIIFHWQAIWNNSK